jgi:hypothetical protein
MNFKSYYFYSLSGMIFMNTLPTRFKKWIIDKLKIITSVCKFYKENVLKKLTEIS